MRKILFVIFAMACVLLVSSLAFAQTINSGAYFVLDTNLAQAGYQENSSQMSIGPSEKVGFAVYAGYVDGLKSYSIDIQWDSALATRSKSDVHIGEDDITINGQAISLAGETNILGEDPTKSPGTKDDAGHFWVAYGLFGSEPVAKLGHGLLYYFQLETASGFTADKALDISVVVTLGSGGIEPPITLSRGVFLVNTLEPDVKSSTWGEVKKKYKDF